MKSKKAFTLMELLVTIAVSTILIAAIGISTYYFSVVNTDALNSAEDYYEVLSIKDYILKNKITDSSEFVYDSNTNELTVNDVTLELKNFSINFDNENGFVYCTIGFEANNHNQSIRFVVEEE